MLSDRGVLTEQGELSDEDIRVPDNVQALIAARLDTLPPERKALLHDAAVVGKVFWAGAIASMGDRDEEVVRSGLHELARKELVRSARTSSVKDQAEYSFWHAPRPRRRVLADPARRTRAANTSPRPNGSRRMAGERVTDQAELLAYHYEQALELARAAGDASSRRRSTRRPALRFLVLAGRPRADLSTSQKASCITPALLDLAAGRSSSGLAPC